MNLYYWCIFRDYSKEFIRDNPYIYLIFIFPIFLIDLLQRIIQNLNYLGKLVMLSLDLRITTIPIVRDHL